MRLLSPTWTGQRINSEGGQPVQILKELRSRLGIIGELVAFFWQRKLWWLIPMVLVLLLFGLLMIFAQTSSIAPFIYTLF
jgi:hypothetical protein